MDLRTGCPLVVAPHFHLPADWPERLLLGTVQEADGGFFPGPSWRIPTAQEMALLVGDPLALTQEDARNSGLCLLALPQHLQAKFWRMLEETQTPQAESPLDFDGFVAEVARFLDFKGLPVPPGAVIDLVVTKPGQPSIQWDADVGRPIGLTFNLASWLPWPLKDEGPGLWGGFNLGDEPVQVVFINLPAQELAAELVRCHPNAPPPTNLDELGRQFLTHLPNYPLVRLRIDPGEGYRVPAGGFLIDACTLDAQSPGLMLMIRRTA